MKRIGSKIIRMATSTFSLGCKRIWVTAAVSLISCWTVSGQESKEPQTFARFVPERKDDFAWENDKIAFRAYGPALRSDPENSGFDAWLKRVDYPIINKWYEDNKKGKSYHKDHGEGLDNYKVGASAGVGGTGLWINGKREPLETFTAHEIIEVTPERSRFKLTYENVIDGVTYGEVKTITIELGSRFFHVASTFTKNGQPAPGLPVCIGLTLQNGTATPNSDRAAGWISTWGQHDDSELGTGVKMDPKAIDDIIVTNLAKKQDNHILIITQTDAEGSLRYSAGYSWKKAGEITSQEEWEAYLNL